MPTERRNLRSNKPDASSPTDGDKPRSNSSGSSNKKDRLSHTRAASSRSKSISKKGVTSLGKEMSGDKEKINGGGPAENGVNGTDDVEMTEESSKPGQNVKPGKDEGDEEMTVVVPPSKVSKSIGSSGQEKDADVAMNGTPGADDAIPEAPEEDPKEKAVTGEFDSLASSRPHFADSDAFHNRYQGQLCATGESCQPF
jgi:hypothetical protein